MSIAYCMMTINEQYLHRMTWHTVMCGRMIIDLLYGLDPMVKEIYEIIMRFGSNGYLMWLVHRI
jgi:hypothetical protein